MTKFLPIARLLVAGLALAGASQGADAPTRLPEFFVPGERVGALEIVVPRGDLQAPAPNLGRDLLAVPGVFGHARAADAMEPNIRGLGLDRVATTVNGIPLVNASPERTNSPVVILGPAAVTGIVVTKALPSVTLGPLTTGGRISLDTADGTSETQDATATLNTGYDESRDGFMTRSRLSSRFGPWKAHASFFLNSLGDYTAANGRQVAARLEEHGGAAGLEFTRGGHRARVEVIHRRLRLQETVSLPLDGKNTDSEVFTFDDRWTNRAATALQAIEWRVGYTDTDPYITSELRAVPTLSFAQATARSFGGGVNTIWHTGDGAHLSLGADYSDQKRRAVRTTPAGKDFIWPGATYQDTGVFAEWKAALAPTWRLRVGLRGDDVRSDAKDADQLALGRPIRDQFLTYNGPGAAKIARHDQVGAANVLVEWSPKPAFSAFAGAGLSAQPAQVMERYRAFLNALGGDGRGGNAVELGNPALGTERKAAIEAGAIMRLPGVEVEGTVYHYAVDNFILRKPVGTTEPPLARMVVFGYRNIDAEFSGAELAATLKPAAGWTVPLTFAIAEGRNRDAHAGLAEIPPWESTFSVRYNGALLRHAVAFDFGGRLVAAKDNPAPLDNPIFANTGGFTVWHARVGLPLGRRAKIEAGLENLFDRNYSEYLSPPTAPVRPASGNLLPGERVPAPGRAAWVSITLVW